MKIRMINWSLSVIITCTLLGGCKPAADRQYGDYSSSSGIDTLDAGQRTVDNLADLCKIWGYVKYHHPDLSGVSMDYELFELIPAVAYKDRAGFDTFILEWLEGLGTYKPVRKRYDKYLSPADYECVADPQEWITAGNIADESLKARLTDLRYVRRSGNNKYVWYDNQNNRLDFKEEPYDHLKSLDLGYQLLALFRYWNIIEYFYPNKLIADTDWRRVLPDIISLLLDKPPGETYRHHLCMANTAINDSHAYMDTDFIFGDKYIPVRFEYIDSKLYLSDFDSSAIIAGSLALGDEIVAVGDSDIPTINAKVRRYMSMSNEKQIDRSTGLKAKRTHSDTITLHLRRDDGLHEVTMKTRTELFKRDTLTTPYYLLNNDVGYLNTEIYNKRDDRKIMTMFLHTKAVVVDLRSYPRDDTVYRGIFSTYFCPHPTVVAAASKPDVRLPGYFALGEVIAGKWNPYHYKGRVVLLVDANTMSNPEFMAMCFQTLENTTTIGSQSAGSDGNVAYITLPGGITTRITGLGWYYPNGDETQRTGVKIDIEVGKTAEDIKSGRDPVLQAALEYIEAQI